MEIVSGAELLAPPDPRERQLLWREGCGPAVRMSCLAEAVGDGEISLRVGGGLHTVPVATRRR